MQLSFAVRANEKNPGQSIESGGGGHLLLRVGQDSVEGITPATCFGFPLDWNLKLLPIVVTTKCGSYCLFIA